MQAWCIDEAYMVILNSQNVGRHDYCNGCVVQLDLYIASFLSDLLYHHTPHGGQSMYRYAVNAIVGVQVYYGILTWYC